MDFSKVNTDENIEQLGEDQLRDLVTEYQKAQDENLAEFKSAKERVEELEGSVEDANEFHETLTEELVEVSPLTETDVTEYSLSRKYELIDKFTTGSTDADTDSGGTDDDVNDFGQRGETHEEGDGVPEFVKQSYENVDGIHLD